MKGFKQCLLLLLFFILKGIEMKKIPPNIIIIYADDLGWNDVSIHGSPEVPTPNIDALAMNGILLNNYYGYWMCTPSRAALLSGKNPIRLGLHHFVLKAGEASGLPLDVVTMPQYLKKFGFETHMIGKWHLGFTTKDFLPTHRGFDSFFGYWNGYIDYYDYVAHEDSSPRTFFGIDLHNGSNTVRNLRGVYATELFTEEAETIIRNHDTSKPLFLYFAHLAVHTGNSYMPQQAPPKYVERVKHIKDINRRVHAAVACALDDSVGNVFKALHDKGILENSIVIFASDNGGETIVSHGAASSNFPLRGKKNTVWEGGNRLPAIVWSPLFNLQKPRISKQLMHVSDWLPTLYRAVGGNPKDLDDMDGIDMWEALVNDLPSPRNEMLYSIDPIVGVSAIRKGDLKVVNGTSGGYDDWYNPTVNNCFNSSKISKRCHFENSSLVRNILVQSNRWILDDEYSFRKGAEVVCRQAAHSDRNCKPDEKPCLFNVTGDPCEYFNLAKQYPEIVDELMQLISTYNNTAVPPQYKHRDPRANPECHDFAYVPWMEPEHYNECNQYS